MTELAIAEETGDDLGDPCATILRRRSTWPLLGRPGGFAGRADLISHLSTWLADPGEDVRDALARPLHDATCDSDHARDGLRCGDLRIDAALDGMLRNLGIDPRSFSLLAAIHTGGVLTLGGTGVAVRGGYHEATRVFHVSGIVDLDADNSVITDAGRIEIAATLPDTVLAAIPGRPVTDVLDHPLLRGVGLVVHDAHLIGFGTRIIYRNTPSRTLWTMEAGRNA